jgi:drug/metabolite transporter (DMT)-like permease
MKFIGEIAALVTSFCWTMSAVGFSNATQQFGSQVTNRLRVVLAVVALILINTLLYAKPIPFDAGLSRWGWLTISGIIGLALGDAFLFSCYRHVGPRIGLLLLSLAPIFGAISAWLMFGETLTIMQILGIAVTLCGISWVVFARGEGSNESDHDWRKGLLLGVLAAFCQATGLVLSKQGMADGFSPFAATLIRMIAAVTTLWIMALFQKQAGKTVRAVREHPLGLKWALFGSFFGPVFGVTASLFAIQHAEIGVASTLMALPPIVMLPISYFFYKEKLNWQAVVGTLVAIGGVALLFLK